MKRTIKMLCLALVGLLAAVAFAEETGSRWELEGTTLTDNTLGNTFTVDVTGDRLTVTGWNTWNANGIVDLAPLNGRDPDCKYKVVAIKSSVFRKNTTLREISLPDSLGTIGLNDGTDEYDAFAGCGNLTTVTPFLPRLVTNLCAFAFQDCTSLTNDLYLTNGKGVTLSVRNGGSKMFQGCQMGNAYFLDFDGTFPSRCFYDCTKLTNMYFVGKKEGESSIAGSNRRFIRGDGAGRRFVVQRRPPRPCACVATILRRLAIGDFGITTRE